MSDVKISTKVRAFLDEIGTVKGGNLVIPIAALDDATSAGRSRLGNVDGAFSELLAAAQPVEGRDGVLFAHVSVVQDKGFPDSALLNASYWSGSAMAGLKAATERGYKVDQHVSLTNPAETGLYFVPLSDEEVQERKTRIAEAEAKSAAKKAS